MPTDPDDTVLVVDDNEVNRALALRQLQKLGYPARAVRNGREALRALEESRYAMVLMDCQMPEMDGFEATRAIRRMEEGTGRRTPVVAMTAGATEADRRACAAAGMDAYISKPVMLDELRASATRWMPRGAKEQTVPPPGPSRIDDAPPPGPAALRQELGREAFARLTDLYTSRLPTRLAAIRRAIDDRNPEDLRAAAHALRSASTVVGGPKLAGLCARLEALAGTGSIEDAGETLALIERECAIVLSALEADGGLLYGSRPSTMA